MQKIAYLGPAGSYSHLAAVKMRPDCEYLPYDGFYRVVRALADGGCDCAVLPIENTLNGAVLQNIDLLQKTEGITATERYALPLDHRLAVLNGADLGKIERIYSHEQPLAQCSEYLSKNYPDAKLIACASTSASLDMLKGKTDAAIVGAHMKREGVTLSKENIADGKNNFTYFLLAERGIADENKHSGFIFFSATCPHRSGALLDILEPMRANGLNMTKIQSRPLKDRAGEYRFFIEVEGDYALSHTKTALKEVEKVTASFKILGVY